MIEGKDERNGHHEEGAGITETVVGLQITSLVDDAPQNRLDGGTTVAPPRNIQQEELNPGRGGGTTQRKSCRLGTTQNTY